MLIAKDFKWEMAHRLPFHKGACKNVHGHSYNMTVKVEGDLDEQGLLIDFYDLKRIVNPLVAELDHACIICKDDTDLILALAPLHTKVSIVDFHSTVENLCGYFLEKISKAGLPSNIKRVGVKIYETKSSYAEDFITLVRE